MDTSSKEPSEIKIAGMAAKLGDIPGGTTVEVINGPNDCPTMFIDGLHGMSISNNIVKIYCIEQMPIEGRVFGRHVLNMVIPTNELIRFSEIFAAAAKQLQGMDQGEQ